MTNTTEYEITFDIEREDQTRYRDTRRTFELIETIREVMQEKLERNERVTSFGERSIAYGSWAAVTDDGTAHATGTEQEIDDLLDDGEHDQLTKAYIN